MANDTAGTLPWYRALIVVLRFLIQVNSFGGRVSLVLDTDAYRDRLTKRRSHSSVSEAQPMGVISADVSHLKLQ
jgi:hypothetical protein